MAENTLVKGVDEDMIMGVYFSAEYSNTYQGSKKGSFIIIAVNDNIIDMEAKDALTNVRWH